MHADTVCPFYPWVDPTEQISTYFMDFKTTEIDMLEVKQLFTDLKLSKYNNYLEIYSDGSKSTDIGKKTSAAFVIPDMKINKNFRLSPTMSVLGAEMDAIFQALTWVLKNIDNINESYKGVVVYTDSRSAAILCAERSPTSHTFMVRKIQGLIKLITEIGKVTQLQWIPAHKNITGNEEADKSAKMALNNDRSVLTHIAREDMLATIRCVTKAIWQEQWNPTDEQILAQSTHLRNIKKYIAEWPWANHKSRTVETTMARLRLGHVGLAQHQHRFGLVDSDRCECGQIETIEHYLIQCQKYKYQRKKLYDKLSVLAVQPTVCDLLGGGQFEENKQKELITALITYLRETNKLGKL